MANYVFTLAAMLMAVSLTNAYCPREKMSSLGYCSYKIHCIGTIRNIRLKEECQEHSDQVNVELELVEAIERINDKYEELEFLKAVTSFKATSASWPETSLSLLEYMPRLKKLNLAGNDLKNITGSPFFFLNNLEILDLSHNNISDIYDLFLFKNESSSLKTIDLSFNSIEDLEGGEFDDVTSLVELDLSYNLLSELTDESFQNLTNLEILKLNNNRLYSLNGSLNDLSNLRQLYLSGNSIKYIDKDSLAVIKHLEVFDISQNKLFDLLPAVLYRQWFGSVLNNGSTCKIIMSGNHIPFVPNATIEYNDASRFIRNTFMNPILNTELDLSRNEITNIEFNAFQSIVNLIRLDLSSNKLLDFIVNSTDLAGVQFLNLSENYLFGIYYETFRSMIKLTNLDLSYNRIEYVPDETFRNNIYLKYVNISFNEFKKIDKLNIVLFSPEGGVLDLSNNAITRLIIPFGEALRLTILRLDSNQITDLQDVNLYYQIDLRVLVLKRNGITHLNEDVVRFPYRLLYLDLSFNKVSDIGSSTFKYLGNLEKLRLGHNSLENLPYGAFQGLNALKFLDLSFNKLRVLDSKTFMDLKHLSILSLRNNHMYLMSYSYWFAHDKEIRVYVDGNNFTCDWVGNALKNYKSGLSKMLPSVLVESVHSDNALGGIPCEVPNQVLANYEEATPKSVVVDERLLITNQKILDALRQQNEFMRKLYGNVN